MIGDKVFTCMPTVIPPFRKPAANKRKNRESNKRLGAIRIDIEHSVGTLQTIWQSLKDLGVGTVDDKSF